MILSDAFEVEVGKQIMALFKALLLISHTNLLHNDDSFDQVSVQSKSQ